MGRKKKPKPVWKKRTEPIKEPQPETWSARMPAYAFTELCPDPNIREPSEVVKQWPRNFERAKWTNYL